MNFDKSNFRRDKSVDLRYNRTLSFLTKSLKPPTDILDIGPPNPFSAIMKKEGFRVQNTNFDLDDEPLLLRDIKTDSVTAFEVLEHLLNPLGVLQNLNAEKLFASVPLALWFAKAYRNNNDPYDCHFHEFEDWQFDWLLEKAGWEIIRREKWNNPASKIGIRPLLRLFTPRYYAIEARRKQ